MRLLTMADFAQTHRRPLRWLWPGAAAGPCSRGRSNLRWSLSDMPKKWRLRDTGTDLRGIRLAGSAPLN